MIRVIMIFFLLLTTSSPFIFDAKHNTRKVK